MFPFCHLLLLLRSLFHYCLFYPSYFWLVSGLLPTCETTAPVRVPRSAPLPGRKRAGWGLGTPSLAGFSRQPRGSDGEQRGAAAAQGGFILTRSPHTLAGPARIALRRPRDRVHPAPAVTTVARSRARTPTTWFLFYPPGRCRGFFTFPLEVLLFQAGTRRRAGLALWSLGFSLAGLQGRTPDRLAQRLRKASGQFF